MTRHMSWFCIHEAEPPSTDDSKSTTTQAAEDKA